MSPAQKPHRSRRPRRGREPEPANKGRSAATALTLTLVFVMVLALSVIALGFIVVGLFQAVQGFLSEGFGKVALGVALGLPALIAGFFMQHGVGQKPKRRRRR